MSSPILEPLTPRETDILSGMVAGLTNAEIAERLVLSPGTVKWYVKQLYGKLGAHSREEAISQALACGLAQPSATAGPDEGCPLINPLPQDVSGRYVGNAEKSKRVEGLLQQGVRLISIYGRAGSGKTALACKALNDLRQAGQSQPRPDGIVCLAAGSTGITLSRVFADLGRLLAGNDQAVFERVAQNSELAPAQKIGILLEKIADKRIVILLDNLESVQDQASGELNEPGLQQFIEMSVMQSSSLTLLVTSRQPLHLSPRLHTWEHLISLEDGLARQDAVALLRRFDPSGAAGLRDAPAEVLDGFADRLGGFPRALESVAGMLLENPMLRLAGFKQAVDRMEGDISAAIVEEALAQLQPAAMQVLEALAVFGQPVSYDALASLVAPFLDEAAFQALLGRLIRAYFVKVSDASQQFSLHPIDQDYCYRQIPAGEAGAAHGGEAVFTRRHLHRSAARYYRANRLPPSACHRIADLEPQLNEFKHWVRAGDGDEAARLILELDRDYLWEWDYKPLLGQCYSALAGLIREPRLEIQVARRQAWLKFFNGTDESEREFRRLLAEARRHGFIKEEADALDDLAQAARRGGINYRLAIEYHQQALSLYRQIGDRRGEADALGGLGAILAPAEPEQAIDTLLDAAEIQRELGNSGSLSFLTSMIGIAYETLGSLGQAMKNYEEAAQIAQQTNSINALSRAYDLQVGLYALTGEREKVNSLVQEAAAFMREFAGVPITGQMMFFFCRAALFEALAGHISEATDLLEAAIRDAEAAQPQLVPMGYFNLSVISMLAGDYQKGRRLLPADAFKSWGIGNTYWIGVLLIKAGEIDSAADFFNGIIAQSQPADSIAPDAPELDLIRLPPRALALAGLALLNQDAAMAGEAAALTRRLARHWNRLTALQSALIRLLAEEPGGAILAPVLAALSEAEARLSQFTSKGKNR